MVIINKKKRESHIRHLKLSSRAPAAAVTPQPSPAESHCAVRPLVSSLNAGRRSVRTPSPVSLSAAQSTDSQDVSLLLSPLRALPKPPVDPQGTSTIRGSRTSHSHSLWLMSLGRYAKASMDFKKCMHGVSDI